MNIFALKPNNITLNYDEVQKCIMSDKVLKNELNDYIKTVYNNEICYQLTLDNLIQIPDVLFNENKAVLSKLREDQKNNVVANINIVLETPKKIVQMCYIEHLSKEQYFDVNNLASTLYVETEDVKEKKPKFIFGTVLFVVYEYDFNEKTNMKHLDMSLNDICQMVRHKLYSTGIKLGLNSNILDKVYITDVNQTDEIRKEYNQTHNSNIFGYNLVFFYKNYNEDNNIINEIATRMAGNVKIYGACFIFHEVQEYKLGRLSRHEFKRLNILSYGRLYDRKMNEKYEETKYINKYINLNKKMLEWNNNDKCYKCFMCEKLFKSYNGIKFGEFYRGLVCSNSCYNSSYKSDY